MVEEEYGASRPEGGELSGYSMAMIVGGGVMIVGW